MQKLRIHSAFLIPETTPGVLVYPTASSVKLIPVGLCQFNQETPKTFTPEMSGDNRDHISICSGKAKPGTWSITVTARPGGSGTPQESPLMTAAFGNESNAAGVTTYSLTSSKQSYSLWLRTDQTVFFATGATVSEYTESLGNECELRLTFSGSFFKLGWVSTATMLGYNNSNTIDITDGVNPLEGGTYSIGGKVKLYDADTDTYDDNSGDGYIITSINNTGFEVTPIVPASPTFEKVVPFFPDGTAEVGSPIPSKVGSVTIGTYNAKFRELNITVNDNIVVPEDEITGDDYPTQFTEGQREVSGSLTMYFRNYDTKFHFWAKDNTPKTMTITLNHPDSTVRQTTLVDVRITNVTVNDDDPLLGVNIEFVGKGTDANNSISVEYS